MARLRAKKAELTRRQIECLEWVALGKSSSDIGSILGISPMTVDEHVKLACDRLGVRTRIQAAILYQDTAIREPASRRS
ncbi:helix-turn-helix transcriptional regulator [Iodidimonas sp. SYSU 1G8]|uniref:helix-turn-helix domain-containing protein n=1 Tax=Iodidimonas sp. SYSU 1G8 TaxID=3133967 RepID=UPI0031FE49B9